VRIQNVLPQKFALALITKGRETNVQKFELSGNNTLDIPLQFENGVDEAILVVSGSTRFTRQKAGIHIASSPDSAEGIRKRKRQVPQNLALLV